jgi:hypothetical protein
MNVADSTVALSLYNVVAIGATTLEDARLALERHGYLVPLDALERALRQLVERGFVNEDVDRIGVTGPLGYVVVERDGSDPEGWKGWRISAHAQQPTEPLVGLRRPT